MGDIVTFDNNLNKLNLGALSKVSLNLFMTLCFYLKRKGTDTIELSYSELKKKAKITMTKVDDFTDALNYMSDQLLQVNASIILKTASGKREIYRFDLFPTFHISEENELLEVAVNPVFAWLLNEFKAYTSYDLETFVSFRSKYTKNLFRLLMQWDSKGSFKVIGSAIRTFRSKIGVKESYSNAEFVRQCLTPSVKEINAQNGRIKNLSLEIEYDSKKRGKPLKVLAFKWDNRSSRNATVENTKTARSSNYALIDERLKKEGLKIVEKDIEGIAEIADKKGLSDVEIKKRLEYVLHREHIPNIVGYLRKIMTDFSEPIEHQYNRSRDYEQRSYTDDQYKALELKKLGIKK